MLSKGNVQVEFRLCFFFSFSHSLQVLNTHAQRFDSDEHIAWCNGRRRKVYVVEDQHKIDAVYNTLKADTKYSHSIRGRPTLHCKRWGALSKWVGRKPYERSLYQQTFTSEPFIKKHAVSTELFNINWEKRTPKSLRVMWTKQNTSTKFEKSKEQKRKG